MAGRITGRIGSVWLDTTGTGNSPTKVGDIYDWEYEENLDTFNCTIKGEGFSRFRPGQNHARVIARRYVQSVAALAPQVEFAIANGNPIQFWLFGVDDGTDTTRNANTRIFGQGYVTRGRLAAPHEKIIDEIEITVDGAPNTLA